MPAKKLTKRQWIRAVLTGKVDDIDTTPIELPPAAKRPESLQSQIRRFVSQEMHLQMEEGTPSFEEEDDFEMEDSDLLDFTRYELAAMTPEYALDPEAVADGSEGGAGSDISQPGVRQVPQEGDSPPVEQSVPQTGSDPSQEQTMVTPKSA